MSILTARCLERLTAPPVDGKTVDQHIARVEQLLAERRRAVLPVAVERRRTPPPPQIHGEQDQADIATAFAADRAADLATNTKG